MLQGVACAQSAASEPAGSTYAIMLFGTQLPSGAHTSLPHSAELAHCGEIQAPSASQTLPASHPITPSSPKLEHCVGVLQQTAGLCFVQPITAKPTIKTAIRMFMVELSALRRSGCHLNKASGEARCR